MNSSSIPNISANSSRLNRVGRQEAKLEAIPRLLALGLSIEQVAVALDLTVAQVQQAAQN
ncbi:hypothetical protein [Nostoc sp. 'Peltigera malacea cyanobiont' DB3992]|uniref:hypothetical protein n=1 Tax=Nostoc sp. 'Peltigera malacea cyanobiont' DB3992 TaxID=1206980 RepID=UPI00117F5D77|nr:hypothetical protein [Nostoc sp. 'Peltigera malacea cyanobiont' DB3992]